MIKNVQQILTRNFGWKVFSLLTAITLWAIVINIKNPVEIRDFPVYINIVGEDNLAANNIVLANKNNLENMRIIIKVRGNRLGLEKLKANQKNITATVNLQSDMLNSMLINKSANVNVKLPTIGGESFEIIEKNPQNVEVLLEKVEMVQKPVQVALIGEPKNGFVTLQPQHLPSTVEVKGAASSVAKVDSVRVNVDVSSAASDIDVSVEPRAYDDEGNEVLGLELSEKYINVKVGINEYKKVALDGSANQGMLEEGYTVTGIDWEPKFVEVVGSTKQISSLSEIKLPAVDLSGLNETKVITYNVASLLPENLSIRTGTPTEVKVTVTVEKEVSKRFDIPIENIAVNGFTSSTQQYKIVQQPLSIELKGLGNIIDNIALEDIKGTVDIRQYTEGVHDVAVNLVLPQGVVLVGDPPTVNITIAPVNEETQESTESKISTP